MKYPLPIGIFLISLLVATQSVVAADEIDIEHWASGDQSIEELHANRTNQIIKNTSTEITRNKHYQLTIVLPDNYHDDKTKRYPVLYLLDPYWDLDVVRHILNALTYDKMVPEIIIVGIGYASKSADVHRLRQTDYTPVASPHDENSGDAKAFLQFIEEEVIPYTESTFRVDPSFRALSGGSLGGLFGLYAMLEKPNLFQGIISSSPAILWERRWIMKKESDFFHGASKELWKNTAAQPLPSRLYLTVGSEETEFNWANEASAFYSLIENRHYQGFTHTFNKIDGVHHAGVKFPTLTIGLPFIFDEYKPPQ